jgi:TPR repeat protein
MTPEEIKEFNETKLKAENGDITAQYNLGLCYVNGTGTPQNKVEATKWYRKAANQGYPMAQNNLGSCYHEGEGVPKDEVEAVRLFQESAEQGNVIAEGNLGFCYANGSGVPKNQAEAVKWYRRAAEKGNVTAQRRLGVCYFSGMGIVKDEVEAYAWLNFAAVTDAKARELRDDLFKGYLSRTKIKSGQNRTKELQKLYPGVPLVSVRTIEPVYAEYFRNLRLKAEEGDARQQFYLATFLSSGTRITKDEIEAVSWWRKSADQGNAQSQTMLGASYYWGIGVPKDDVAAYAWYNISAAMGGGTKDLREKIGNELSKEEITAAQKLSRELQELIDKNMAAAGTK